MGDLKRKSRDKKLRAAGLIPPYLADASEAKKHLQWLHDDCGMAMVQISSIAGIGESTVSELLSGKRNGLPHTGVLRTVTIDAIMGVQPEVPMTPRGSRIPALGAHRRIKALAAVGYHYQYLAAAVGHSTESRSYTGNFLRNKYTHVKTLEMWDNVYRKLRYVDPLDMGVTKHAKSRTVRRATDLGFPPPSCWDDDTIDRADAFPEWTGACNSQTGVRIHRREGSPVCDACKRARQYHRKEHGNDQG